MRGKASCGFDGLPTGSGRSTVKLEPIQRKFPVVQATGGVTSRLENQTPGASLTSAQSGKTICPFFDPILRKSQPCR